MAKSKVGGSRAYIRGRIGADVYSIGKDGKGTRQQVVRSLAEQVSNPRTESQMFGRMVMSTVMQTVSALKPIIDHSFDGFPTGQPCISEFIRQNYALVKADATAHPAEGFSFGLNKYQEKGAKGGAYVIAKGTAVVPAALKVTSVGLGIQLTASTLTVGGLKDALGLSADGYATFAALNETQQAIIFRVKVSTKLADETVITSSNVASLFSIEGNVEVEMGLNENKIYFNPKTNTSVTSYGLIVSDLVDGAWKHNNATMVAEELLAWSSNSALPTYPTGSQQFLNGGNL